MILVDVVFQGDFLLSIVGKSPFATKMFGFVSNHFINAMYSFSTMDFVCICIQKFWFQKKTATVTTPVFFKKDGGVLL